MSNKTAEKSPFENRRRLIRLIRKIAKEEAWQVMDEHVTDYEHKDKPAPECTW